MSLGEAAEVIVKPGQFPKDGEQESVKFWPGLLLVVLAEKSETIKIGLNGEMEPISLIILRRESPKQEYSKHIGEV